MTKPDLELLREYANQGSEAAFGELVARHLNLVYSVALRQTQNPHMAEEVTQTVFVILARKARALSSKTVLGGWLCLTARHVSKQAMTSLRRREIREHQVYMDNPSTTADETPFWAEVAPLLDAVLGELNRKDHDALVLRFLQGRSFKEAALELGTTEAGAKMRVGRALEKLRTLLAQRGVHLSVAVLASAITAHSLQAAPVGLAGSVTAAAVGGAKLAGPTAALVETSLKFMTMKKSILIGAALGITLLTAGTGAWVLQHQRQTPAPGPAARTGAELEYATPEATFDTMIAALKAGDLNKFVGACTPEFGEQVRKKTINKSDDEVKQMAASKALEFASFQIISKNKVSATEVHLKVRPTGDVGGPPPGTRQPEFRMRQLDGRWKFDGNVQ